MKKITYYCDLCKEERDKANVYQYYFDSTAAPQRYVVKKMLVGSEFSCDKHICKFCIETIKNWEIK